MHFRKSRRTYLCVLCGCKTMFRQIYLKPCSLAEAFFPHRWAFLFYENYLNFNNSIWMSFIYVCFHFTFFASNFVFPPFLSLKQKKHIEKFSLSFSLGNDITEIVLSLCNRSNWKRTQWNSEKNHIPFVAFASAFFFACALALEFHIHILLPLFAIHFTVAFGLLAASMIHSRIALYTITCINRSKSCVIQSYPNGNRSVNYFFRFRFVENSFAPSEIFLFNEIFCKCISIQMGNYMPQNIRK